MKSHTPDTRTKCCANCHFFLQTSEKMNQKTRQTQHIGYCRCNPPIPYFECDDQGIFTPKIGRFPVVLDNMWCGGFDYSDEPAGVAEGGPLCTTPAKTA